VWYNVLQGVARTTTVCYAKKPLGIESVALCPTLPGAFDNGPRIDKNAVKIKEESVASELQTGESPGDWEGEVCIGAA